MKLKRQLMIIGILLLVASMVMATQYAITRVEYGYFIVHPSDATIRFLGSDNSSDGIRILRVPGDNSTRVSLKLQFANYSVNYKTHYSAAFGIVNEQNHTVNISYANVSTPNWTYMHIYLHGNRDANAANSSLDPSSVYMWANNTVVNATNTTAWTLAPGDTDPSTMCSNVSNRAACTINTTWDEIAHVRYSRNNTNATDGVSDFVWVQVTFDVGDIADFLGEHSGYIYFHLETEGE